MTLYKLHSVIDSNIPVWVNSGDNCIRYENITDAARDHGNASVIYITLDGENELTLEIE